MEIFCPDNPRRMDRVRQLVNDILSMQADIKHFDKEMHGKEGKLYPAIHNLVRAHGMDSMVEVIEKPRSKMTADERKVFDALLQRCRTTKTDVDTWYFIAGLLIAPEGIILTGKTAINIARWAARILSLKGLANFVAAADRGEAVATAVAAEITIEAEVAAKVLEDPGIEEAAEAAEVAAEIAEVASVVASVSVFLEVLGGIGLVVGLIAGFLEAFEGEEQKERLVKAIHGLQTARLTTVIFKREEEILASQLEMFKAYVDASPGGSEPDPYRAKYLADRITESIRLENKEIDPGKIETELEMQDRVAILFYGGADLSHDAVVVATSKR